MKPLDRGVVGTSPHPKSYVLKNTELCFAAALKKICRDSTSFGTNKSMAAPMGRADGISF